MSETKYLCTKCGEEVEPLIEYTGSRYSLWIDEEAWKEVKPDWSECCHSKVIYWFVDCEDRPI